MGFRWNLGSNDAETEKKIAPEDGSTDFTALGLDFREGVQRAADAEQSSASDSVRPSTSAPLVSATSTVTESTVVAPGVEHPAPITRRSLRARAAAVPSAVRPAEPVATIQAEDLTPAEPLSFVPAVEAESSPHPVHPAAASRRVAVDRPTGRSKSPHGARPAAAPHKKKRGHLLSKLMTIGAMLGVGGLMISTSLPANAFYSADFLGTTSSAVVEAGPAQTLKVEEGAVPAVAARDSYTVASLAQQMRLKYGNRAFAYTNNPLGTIQWPFPVPVPIASGYGDRYVPNCGYCSTFHQGVDFTPGAGAPIQAIADGVVIGVNSTPGGLGQHVIIEHVINGQKIQSVYAHMLTGSIRVVQGQQIKVTEQVGQVGSTGASTGAHLHLEIHVEGVPVDPFAWLKANAN